MNTANDKVLSLRCLCNTWQRRIIKWQIIILFIY